MNRRINNRWFPQKLREPKHVQLVLKVDEVLQDLAWMTGIVSDSHDAVQPEGSVPQTTLTKDVLEDGNRDLMLRLVDKLMKEVMMFLFPYTKVPLQIRYADNSQNEVTAYVVELTFDYERSDVQVMYLETQIHDYVVKKTLYDWLSYTMVPGQRVSDVQLQQRKMLEEAEFAKGNILTTLAEPMEIRNHHVKASFF